MCCQAHGKNRPDGPDFLKFIEKTDQMCQAHGKKLPKILETILFRKYCSTNWTERTIVKSSQQTKVNCSMFMYFSISSIDNVTSSFKVKLKKINKRTDNWLTIDQKY